MEIADVVKRAYAMPLTNPSFPPGPYRFFDREYIIITYRTTREALEAVVPAPLEIDEPLVKYEFIRMPDSTGFGDYTETGQVIPVRYKGQHGGYVHIPCISTMTRRSPVAASSGVSRRSLPTQRSCMKAKWWSARCTMAAFCAPPGRWATSTAKPIMTRCSLRSPRPIS